MYQQQILKELPFGKKTMRRIASLQLDAVKHSVQQLDETALSGHVQWDLQNPNRYFHLHICLFSNCFL
jgi:hypothetical protein